jgi:predicted dehydrogenase
VSFAVVGCGNIGSRHLAILSELPGARVSAFCDVDERRLESSGILHPRAVAYPSIGDLLAHDEADVVNICTPHYLHADQAIAALEAGRHVLVEKPMCLTIVGERGTVRIGGQYLNTIDHWDVEGSILPAGVAWTDRPNAYGAYQGSSSNHDKVFADVIRQVGREDVDVVSGEEARRTVGAIETVYRGCGRSGPSFAIEAGPVDPGR